MPRNEPLFPAGQIDAATVLTPARMRLLDQRASEGLNVDAGGVWGPTSKIWIGGEGVRLEGTNIAFNSTVETGPGAVGLILGGDEYPFRSHSGSQERRLRIPFTVANIQVPLDVGIDLGTFGGTNEFHYVRDPLVGLKDASVTYQTRPLTIALPQLRMHNGAKLIRVAISMRYERKPTTTAFASARGVPYARIVRWAHNGSIDVGVGTNDFDLYLIPEFQATHAYVVGEIVLPTTPDATPANRRQYRVVTAGTSGASSAGWSTTVGAAVTSGSVTFRVEPRPLYEAPENHKHHYATLPFEATLEATATAHYQNGLPFELEFAPNNANVIDTDEYGYALEILSLGETGTTFHSVELEFEDILTMKEP